MFDTSTCSGCGSPDRDGRGLFPVLDETGRTDMCGLCLITVLAKWPSAEDVTVFLAGPTVLPQM